VEVRNRGKSVVCLGLQSLIDDGLIHPYRMLTLAVLHLAVKDVRKPNSHATDAIEFLYSGWCLHLTELVDVEHDLTRLLGELAAGRRPQG